ncbi:MAG: hypothetical protein ABI284_07845 [Nitrosospira sp.]
MRANDEFLSPRQCTEIVTKVGRATPDDRTNDVGRSPTYFTIWCWFVAPFITVVFYPELYLNKAPPPQAAGY